MFYDNLKSICERKNIKMSPLLEKLGFAKSSITNWKKGALPKSEVIIKLCEELNISADFLIFGKNDCYLNEIEEKLLSSFRKLSRDDQLKEIGRLETLTEIENLAKTKEIKLSDIEKNA